MKKILAFIFIFLAVIIWSTSFLVMKNALDNISPGAIIFFRALIAFLILIPFSIKHLICFNKKQIILLVVSGIFVALGYLTQVIGLQYTTPGKNAFLENSYCIVVPILTCVILKRKLSLVSLLSIVICIIGIVVIGYESLTESGSSFLGDIFSTLAGVFFAVNIVLTGLYSKKCNAIAYTCGQFFIIVIVSGLYSLIFEDISAISLNDSSILELLYLGVIVTALAWVLRNYSQQILSPISVSIILPFTSVLGALVSIIAKEDVLTVNLVVGGVLIVFSILLDALLSNKKKVTA